MKMKLSPFIMILSSGVQWIDGEFLGCFEDNSIRLMLGFHVFLNDVNTPARCSYVCQRLQFRYSGVQFSTQCYCGSDRPYERMRRNISECNMPCPGGRENCGGSMRLSAYYIDKDIYPTTGLRTSPFSFMENYRVVSADDGILGKKLKDEILPAI